MSLIFPFAIAGISSTFVLTLLYLYLYAQYRERYIGIWAGSWLICVTGSVFIFIVAADNEAAIVFGEQAFAFLSCLFLMWGTYTFLKRPMPRFWIYSSAAGNIWLTAGAYLQLPFTVITLPDYIILASMYVWTGLLFLRFPKIRGAGRSIAGWSLILWGIHIADYPFLRPMPGFAPWGYFIGWMLLLTAAIGMLLVYFNKIRRDLSESEERFRLLAENAQDLIYRYRIAPEPGFEYLSPAITAITGYTPEEHYTDPDLVCRIIHPDDRELFKTVTQETLPINQPLTLRWTRKDGGVIWAEQRVVQIYDKAGNLTAIEGIARDITGRMQVEEALRASEEKCRLVVENANEAIFVVQDGLIKFANPKILEFGGYNTGDSVSRQFINYIHPDDRAMVMDRHMKRIRGEDVPNVYTFRIINREVHVRHVEINSVPIAWEGKPATLNFMCDITQRRKAEDKLQESQEALRKQVNYLNILIENLNELFCTFDLEGKITFVNRKLREVLGYSPEEIIGAGLPDLVAGDCREKVRKEIGALLEKGNPGGFEARFRHKNDNQRILKINASPIIEEGQIRGGMVLAEDVTDRKRTEEKLKYLSLHDSLTGLYNRAYFEQEMRRLAGNRYMTDGIILCDVDGLKLVNDTLGHDVGDAVLLAAASVIKGSFREGDMVARIGGDEFAVLLPNTDRKAVESASQRIREAVVKYNAENREFPLSISVGFASSVEMPVNPGELFKEADNNMYREKLHRNQSARSAIVQALIKAMEARDYTTEGHTDRLQDLVESLARNICLPNRNITDLRLLARFHDIGKVGIPDRILFKPGPLTREEKNEMKRHCEIGHRIAQSASDLAPIADWILKHHEWWNGQGYPLGLKSEEIPLECRILAIADAYDSMTNDRPYRNAMPRSEAAAELRRCAGVQFDPQLVFRFLEVVDSRNLA